MLRSLLAERFHLAAHVEDRQIEVYMLEVANGGTRLKTASGPEGWVKQTGLYRISSRSGSMAQLALHLNVWVVHCPVLDKTGLDGLYDFTLQWAPADTNPETPVQDAAVNYSVLKALEAQLGLRLKLAKAPVPVVVVDAADRPTEN
jgi:uncharacterized protein (TIGR03435 family)